MLLDMGFIFSVIAANLQQSDNETYVPEILLFFFSDGIQKQESGGGPPGQWHNKTSFSLPHCLEVSEIRGPMLQLGV